MMQTNQEALPSGRHILLELCECPRELLDSPERLGKILESCAVRGGATVVSSSFHRFNPQGVSGVVVIAESHLTIHTWPEHGYAAVDVFTCGHRVVADRIAALVVEDMHAGKHQLTAIQRQPPSALPATSPAL
jgi:S-adenosylmethionine decarboxylase